MARVGVNLPGNRRGPFLAHSRFEEFEPCLQFFVFIGHNLQVFFGKLSHTIGKGRPLYVATFKELVRNKAVKCDHIIYEDLELDPDVIVIDMDLGNIGRILRTG